MNTIFDKNITFDSELTHPASLSRPYYKNRSFIAEINHPASFLFDIDHYNYNGGFINCVDTLMINKLNYIYNKQLYNSLHNFVI